MLPSTRHLPLEKPASFSNHTSSIAGPAGRLEIVVGLPDPSIALQGLAIVCHPHPLHAGTMDNKVVCYMARTLNSLGIGSVRFNFRGVGQSTGIYGEGHGETQDALAVAAWIKCHYPDSPLWLSGFSFGAYIALRAASLIDTAQLITIAPPVNFFDFSAINPPPCPWLVIQGTHDDVVPHDDVSAWIDALEPRPAFISMPNADHFFHGRLNCLRNVLVEALEPRYASRNSTSVAENSFHDKRSQPSRQPA